MNNSKHTANIAAILKAIEIAKGIKNLAIALGTSYQSVLDWKNQRRSPSPTNCQKIEKVTNGEVKAKDILPDFPWETLK